MVSKKRRDAKADLEKQKLLDPEKASIKKKKQKKRIFFAIGTGVFSFFLILAISFGMIREIGKSRLLGKAEAAAPDLQLITAKEMLTQEEEIKWQEGWVKYKDTVYAYNDEMMTFLFMGIDKEGKAEAVEEGTDGGQADVLFLAAVNPKDKTVKAIGINRNTMADVDIYNGEGAYVTTKKAQIAVQHGFGNGAEESCEYQCRAVSRFFYHLPIHGYAAINMSAIPAINDAVGGVDVTVLEDLSRQDGKLAKGEKVHLEGNAALLYVRYRDMEEFGSADRRLERQKQYLAAFMGAVKKAVGEDIGSALELYRTAAPMMVTDIAMDEAVYLASSLLDYSFAEEGGFYMVKGETVMGERFEEFYADETALYEMILEIFYEPVEM